MVRKNDICCSVWLLFASNHLKNIDGCTPELEYSIVGLSLIKSCTFLFPTDAGGRFSMANPSPKASRGNEEKTTVTNKNANNESFKVFCN